jgi:hypothetical protein
MIEKPAEPFNEVSNTPAHLEPRRFFCCDLSLFVVSRQFSADAAENRRPQRAV